MHLYHPVMFVGLGGTGCRIGAELERRLREELCGPDGEKLRGTDHNLTKLRPYQLPGCLQFVYADLSEDELGRLRKRSVPNEAHADVAERTAYYAYDLLPEFRSYPEVAKNLRVKVPDFVRDWLPPGEQEPMVVPLRLGAGQLPTVGRAALFQTISDSVETVRAPISKAIGAITKSAPDLQALNPDRQAALETVDVFVAFSVAGGTGAGIFYDYLHIVDSAFQIAGLDAKIYPLVLMPSAFDVGQGGGMSASLNAGRALLDMFRLVDDLNQDQRSHGDLGGERVSAGLHVRYPQEKDLMMRLGSTQTAFLFSKAAGIERNDLHRSVVALIMSLVGLDTPTGTKDGGAPQSFADGFINSAVDRQSLSPTRIGRRGVSTSLVGSLTVPFDDLADMFAVRLLGRGVRELLPAPPGRAEANRESIRGFFLGAAVGPVWERGGVSIDDPAGGAPAKGAANIRQMLQERAARMGEGLKTLDQNLARTVPELARDFNPLDGAMSVLRTVDLFRLRRVLVGDPSLTEKIDKLGVAGVMEARRMPPTSPVKEWETDPRPPQLVEVRNRMGGMLRATATERSVLEMLKVQDSWYRYRIHRLWHEAWHENRSMWQPRLERLIKQVRALVDELATHERESDEVLDRRAEELYRPRVGVTYLLPPRQDLERTYAEMLRRLADGKRLRRNATEGEIVATLLSGEGWQEALRESTVAGRGADHGLRLVLARLKQEVVRILRGGDHDDAPLMPQMSHLLRAAAKRVRDVPVAESDVQHFAATLSGMLPAAFRPAGTGQLSLLVVYPAATPDPDLERYLRTQLRLQSLQTTRPIQFQTAETESITVVLVRSGMGVTEVPELRQVLLDWATAVRDPWSDSYLPWRQRLGFDADWLATTEAHRQEILHRLLCAVWNGQVTCTGATESPSRLRITLTDDPGAEAMSLELSTFGRASSWGSLLRHYELWTLTDGGQIRLNFCASLMETKPKGFDTTVTDPNPLYWDLISMAERQVKTLTEMRERMPTGSRQRCDQYLHFWERTFPAARDRVFFGDAPNGDSLRALEKTVRERGAE